jgi:hypothetical protein
VLGHLSERDQPMVRRQLRAAWALDDHDGALERLRALADELARSHLGAAASLREGLEETLTVTRLGVRGRLKRTLSSTNPCESMIDTIQRVARYVKRWQNGDMYLRWTARRHPRSRRPVPPRHRSPRPWAGSLAPSSATSPPDAPPTGRPRPPRPRRPRSPLAPPEIVHSRTAALKFHGERDILTADRSDDFEGTTGASTPVLR